MDTDTLIFTLHDQKQESVSCARTYNLHNYIYICTFSVNLNYFHDSVVEFTPGVWEIDARTRYTKGTSCFFTWLSVSWGHIVQAISGVWKLMPMGWVT